MKKQITREQLESMLDKFGETSTEIDGVSLSIEYDKYPEPPLDNFEWLGTLACHARVLTGHEQFTYLHTHMLEVYQKECGVEDRQYRWEPEKLTKEFSKKFYWLPVYMYSHSGVTIATTPFSCRFDSGQVGFIYVSKKKAANAYGYKRPCKALADRVVSCLNDEIKTYDQYLAGEVYLVELEYLGETEVVGGFYGDHKDSGAIEHLCELYNSFVKQHNGVRVQSLKTLIKNHVPLPQRERILQKSA